MDNPRAEKVAIVDEIATKLSDAKAVFVTEYRGLKVGALATLRGALRDSGAEHKVYKNTLARFAADKAGLDGLKELLVGPTALTFVGDDSVAAAKALRDTARTNPLLVLKGGALGTNVLTAADITALADLPSREELLARSPEPCRRRSSRRPACCRPCPATSPTASGPHRPAVGRRRRLTHPHSTQPISKGTDTTWQPRKRSSIRSAPSPCSS